MDSTKRDKLVKRAQRDPEFFHALVFDTDTVIDEVGFLDDRERAALKGLRPEAVIDVLTGGNALADCGITNTCGHTCGITSTGLKDIAAPIT
jgi:hypothetical protein